MAKKKKKKIKALDDVIASSVRKERRKMQHPD